MMATIHVIDFKNCPDPPSVFVRWAQADARRARREQGLGATVTDPATLERLAVMLRGGS